MKQLRECDDFMRQLTYHTVDPTTFALKGSGSRLRLVEVAERVKGQALLSSRAKEGLGALFGEKTSGMGNLEVLSFSGKTRLGATNLVSK